MPGPGIFTIIFQLIPHNLLAPTELGGDGRLQAGAGAQRYAPGNACGFRVPDSAGSCSSTRNGYSPRKASPRGGPQGSEARMEQGGWTMGPDYKVVNPVIILDLASQVC